MVEEIRIVGDMVQLLDVKEKSITDVNTFLSNFKEDLKTPILPQNTIMYKEDATGVQSYLFCFPQHVQTIQTRSTLYKKCHIPTIITKVRIKNNALVDQHIFMTDKAVHELTENTEVSLILFPNVYSNSGKVCTGGAYNKQITKTNTVRDIAVEFLSSKFNQDLYEKTNIKELFTVMGAGQKESFEFIKNGHVIRIEQIMG